MFHVKHAAKLYARGRPRYHDLVIQRIAAQLGIHQRLGRALDVACGTGLSCMALQPIAERIIGADVSAAMLGQAGRDEHIDYLLCPAETLPLAAESLDLLTVSSALHWFDRDAFLAEARRVLKPRSWLVVYNNVFCANLQGNPRFKSWVRSTYLERFPTPPRNNKPLNEQSAKRAGFNLVKQETYTNVVDFDRRQLVNYLLTQTNVLAAIAREESTLDDARAYLATEVKPFFTSSEQRAFDFGGPIVYLRKGC